METSKAIDPPSNHGGRKGDRKSKFLNSNKNRKSSIQDTTNGKGHGTQTKKLYINSSGETNLMKWMENIQPELGAKYGSLVTSIFKQQHYKVSLPKRIISADRMVTLACGVQRQLQLGNGIAEDDIEFNFEDTTYDEVIESFTEDDIGPELFKKVAGLSEDDVESFQKHLDELYEQKLKVYRSRIEKVQIDKEQIFYAIQERISENSLNIIKDASEDFDALSISACPFKLVKLILDTHYINKNQVPSMQKSKVRNAFYRDFTMKSNQSISSFRQEFEWHCSMFKKVGLSMGTDEDVAGLFMDKLNSQYDGLRLEQERLEKRGTLDPPKSVKEAYQLALQYTPDVRMQGTTMSVFNTEISSGTRGNNSAGKNEKKGGKSGDREKNRNDGDGTTGKNRGKNKNRGSNRLKCYLCDESGHRVDQCPKLSQCKQYIASEEKDEEAVVNFYSNSINCIMCYEIDHTQCAENPYEIFIDNCAEVSLFKDCSMLDNIKKCSIRIKGIQSNVNNLHIDTCGTFLNGLLVNVNKLSSRNILSQGQILELPGWDVTMDNDTKNLILTVPGFNQSFIFKRNGRLWSRSFRDLFEFSANSVQTIKNNEIGYSKLQLAQARLAVLMRRRLGYPSPVQFLKQVGSMADSTITPHDAARCLQIYGKGVYYLKGKETKRPIFFTEPEEIPRVIDKVQTLYMDIVFIFGLAFLISVSSPMDLTIVNPLGKQTGARSSSILLKAINNQINIYRKYGFLIKNIHSDREGSVAKVIEAMDYVRLIPTASGEHVGQVESKNRHLKNTCRAIFHSLPYELSEAMMIWLVLYSVRCINMQHNRNKFGDLAPIELLTGIKLNMKRDLRIGFGEYCQVAARQSNNSMEERTCGAISLLPVGHKGSIKFLNLATGKVVTRKQFEILPMTEDHIHLLNSWAKQSSVTAGMTAEEAVNFDRFLVEEENNDAQVDDLLPEMLLVRGTGDQRVRVDEPRQPVTEIPVSSPPQEEQAEQASSASASVQSAVTVTNSPDTVVPPVQTGVGKPVTVSSVWIELDEIYFTVNNMTLHEATRKFGNLANEAATDEIMQLHRKPVWTGVLPSIASNIPKDQVVNGKLFMRDKRAADNTFDKLKGRYVTRGDMVPEELKDFIDSPTVTTTALFTMLAIGASEGRQMMSDDIPMAYTNAKRKVSSDRKRIYMKLTRNIVDIIVKNDSSFQQFVNSEGTAVVEIIAALYGLTESSGLWYEEISNFLKSLGFTENGIEKCVFNKMIDGDQCTILLYVDDMLGMHKSIDTINDIFDKVDVKYGKGKRSTRNIINFLGMSIDLTEPGVVSITTPKLIENLLKEWNITDGSEFPAQLNLFEEKVSPLLDNRTKKKFHSGVMSALFICKRPRPDCLLPVNYLSTKVLSPTKDHLKKFLKVLRYLYRTKNLPMRLFVGNDKRVKLYVDASYGVHVNGHSHTGMVLKYGKATLEAKSSKQKIVTKSSCEAELIAASDEAGLMIHIQEFLKAQGYGSETPVLYQDNQSAIKLEVNGKNSSNRTKHISIRYFWLKDEVAKGVITIEYLATEEMIADLLTKPLQGEAFYKFRKEILNEV